MEDTSWEKNYKIGRERGPGADVDGKKCSEKGRGKKEEKHYRNIAKERLKPESMEERKGVSSSRVGVAQVVRLKIFSLRKSQ